MKITGSDFWQMTFNRWTNIGHQSVLLVKFPFDRVRLFELILLAMEFFFSSDKQRTD